MPYATDVIAATGRLLRSGLLKRPPAWWSTVQAHPPAPASFARTHRRTEPASREWRPRDRRRDRLRPPKPRLPEIRFALEDEIRVQFYADHPWEAARGHHVVEADTLEDAPGGSDWILLSDRSGNPLAEDAIAYAVNLVEAHNIPKDDAYRLAISQFRELRAQHEVATRAAVREAEAYGTVFADTVVDRGLKLEAEAFEGWAQAPALVYPATTSLVGDARGLPAPAPAPVAAPSSSASAGSSTSKTGREVLQGFAPQAAPQPFTAGTAYLAQPLPSRSRKPAAPTVEAPRSTEPTDEPTPMLDRAIEMIRAERQAQPPSPEDAPKPSQTRSTRQKARPLSQTGS